MSTLLSFYRGDETDAEGRRIDEIWAWSDDDWEAVHDYIQWLFPTKTASAFNSNAPVLTAADIAAFQSDEKLQSRLQRSFLRFLEFVGLELKPDGQIDVGRNFNERCPEIWTYANHNWLRISRVLDCLKTLGLDAEARALFQWLDGALHRGVIGAGEAASRAEAVASLAHWRKRATSAD